MVEKSAVIPVESPTVQNAETVSNNILSGSLSESVMLKINDAINM